MIPFLVLAAALAYLAGSIPTAYLAVRFRKGTDIRDQGSGNVGATNALRVLGPGPALAVAAADFAKGFVPVFLVGHYGAPAFQSGNAAFFSGAVPGILTGTAAVVGHLFPVFLGFRGGKGVATGAGVLTALFPPLFPACIALFGLALALFRRASVASLIAAASVPFLYAGISLTLGLGLDGPLMAFTVLVPIMVIASHRKNIKALLEGREKRLF